ncbi:putative copper-transporting atpase 1 protein [Botrytis fragariae]|uniref:Putative copper-transporting atpase 1 protein n=1 Tax=Botrytis fragariae TaxID=1964551 RepID=A0A8H6EFL0_9HELO|nr:putative copper-transporting atpase 1 protein [Botrytis fragariae]KAF5870437.1 putative copper-transporting atpase 1 protein [Botrytis fragariae]
MALKEDTTSTTCPTTKNNIISSGEKMENISTHNSVLITTSYLLSNLHCPSCVSNIQKSLYALSPRPKDVTPSLMSSWVTVQHDNSLSTKVIRKALQSAGFEVCDVTSEEHGSLARSHIQHDTDTGYLDQVLQKWSATRRPRRQFSSSYFDSNYDRHLENCEICRQDATTGANQQNVSKDLGQSGILSEPPYNNTSDGRNDGTTESSGKRMEPLVVVDTIDSIPQTFRASLAIGGMTCAACANNIVLGLKKKSWVRDVVVNLISNSATVDFADEKYTCQIVEEIEDLGYDAALDSVIDLKPEPQIKKVTRTVEIMVNGMYCGHCPPRINNSLISFGDRITIERALSLENPILKITYTPSAPTFTIRQILSKISNVEEGFVPTIYHPPTIEERSQIIHKREQQRILLRVIVTLIIAIPTLLIGIIFMSLVPPSNKTRQYFMQPLRAGVDRAQWSLLVMATPVYFLCADVFHRRALKEIRSLWRPGSTTPILQRFYRFGSMNMLMSLGTTIAYVSSVAQLIAAAIHPTAMVDDSSFYFDSVVFLTLFLLVGRLIEAYSKSRTDDAVTMLGKLRPTEALLIVPTSSYEQDGDFIVPYSDEHSGTSSGEQSSIRSVNVDLLEFGDTIKVLHGGSPACDGTVIKGETKFDESSLTGEAKLVKKSAGDEVFSGTVNKESPVTVKITGVAGSSMLDQIVMAVREGQTKRAPMERIADTLTGYFVPVITLIAILTFIVWLSLGLSGVLPDDYRGSSGWAVWSLQFAIAVFVVACPCGLALAAPTALFVGGGLAAHHGILVKGGGEAFEKASMLDCVVFDKTGTLTLGGEPTVTNFEFVSDNENNLVVSSGQSSSNIQIVQGDENVPNNDIISGNLIVPTNDKEQDLLNLIKAAEENSSHTVAKAIVSFCANNSKPSLKAFTDIEEMPGYGMRASFRSGKMLIGNESLMTRYNVKIAPIQQSRFDIWKQQGKSVALVACSTIDGPYKLTAVFAISDPIRPEAISIISALKARGTAVWMLSGDNQTTANAIGQQVGIAPENIIAGVLPSEKANQISYLQKSLPSKRSKSNSSPKRALVAMVGDGINDSPALTTADVGIAIGSGSDIAISSAEFVLVSSNLHSLITLLDLSKMVFQRIKFNFGWALIYNLVALPVAAGIFYPIVTGGGKHVRLDPVWASLAMAMSSISVVLSSLALRSRVPGLGFKARKMEG